MPDAKQIKGTNTIMLLGGRAWLVPHDLSDDTGRAFDPFRQRPEAAPQSMQCQAVDFGDDHCLIVRIARFGNASRLRGWTTEYPRAAPRQGGNQMRHVGRKRNGARPVDLVADGDASPAEIDVLP